jgi:type IV secretory pathway TrbF-like protein
MYRVGENWTSVTPTSFSPSAHWQIVAGCSLLVSLVLTVGPVSLLRSRYVPYVVVMDRFGQAITIPEPFDAVVNTSLRLVWSAGNSGVHQRRPISLKRSSR